MKFSSVSLFDSFRRTVCIALLALVSAALLTACDPYAALPGGGGSQAEIVAGTVDYVDANDRRIMLINERGGGTDSMAVYYDAETPVYYDGQTYRPEALERGDRVEARVDDVRGRLFAQSIDVTYNVATERGDRDDDVYDRDNNDRYGDELRGTVRFVNERDRTIEVERDYDRRTINVAFDERTEVEYNNRRSDIDALRRGDRVEIDYTDRRGQLLADEIVIVGDAGYGRDDDRQDDAYGDDDFNSDLRGTVAYVNAADRLFALERTNYRREFSAGDRDDRVIILFDNRTEVIYRGERGYEPANMERGDVVDVNVRPAGQDLLATEIYVVKDSTPGR